MAIRFSASEHAVTYSPSRRIMRVVYRPYCNDNDSAEFSDVILQASLRLFAEHGISAAAYAREKLEEAFFSGKEKSFRWWSSVCRTLDREINAQSQSNPPKVPQVAEKLGTPMLTSQ